MPSLRKRIAIVQSNYLPWKGYFDLVNSVDEFVLYDDVQYTKRDWRSRNRVIGPSGPIWLTIPVSVKGKYFQAIKDVVVADPTWNSRHWRTLCACYGSSKFFDDVAGELHGLYHEPPSDNLSLLNRGFIEAINAFLGITTKISWSMDYEIQIHGDKSARLLGICQQAGADEYLSGPSAGVYLDVDIFAQAGVSVRWMDYSGYPEYPQASEVFVHEVSIVDLLFNTGRDATRYMLTSGS